MSEILESVKANINGELHGNATLVSAPHRMAFLPKLFGNGLYLKGEGMVFDFMSGMSEQYTGGHWEFVKIPGGVGYMRPAAHGLYKLTNTMNGWDGEVSGDAAGIIMTLMALSHLSFSDRTDTCAENFHTLRDFMADHPEAREIYRAID
ncbi:antirestriction protein [Aquabacterium sp. NJ1]|uniref:antirestriction protein n=1 Tax=Aquabacterium sp. NJ1 TaxID=1538295 RepID=UPI000691BA29|nr:antirestriction protein [Aquabacterium sp. NJ1]